MEQGLKKGTEQGIEIERVESEKRLARERAESDKRLQQEKLTIAKNLKNAGVDSETIESVTGLGAEEITGI